MSILKNYKINLVKNYYNSSNKTNVKLLFIYTSFNFNSNNLALFKKKINSHYSLKVFKIRNNLFKITLKNSIHNFLGNYFNNLIFFIEKFNNNSHFFDKKLILKNLNLFYLLSIKLNNKIYSANKARKIFCFNYYQLKKILFKFITVNFKKINNFSK
jgi:hypothetical protein